MDFSRLHVVGTLLKVYKRHDATLRNYCKFLYTIDKYFVIFLNIFFMFRHVKCHIIKV